MTSVFQSTCKFRKSSNQLKPKRFQKLKFRLLIFLKLCIFVTKDQTLQKFLLVEAELSAIKSYLECELSILNSKKESPAALFNDALKNFWAKRLKQVLCSTIQDNLLFLQKGILSKDEIIRFLVVAQTSILNYINCRFRQTNPPRLSQPGLVFMRISSNME